MGRVRWGEETALERNGRRWWAEWTEGGRERGRKKEGKTIRFVRPDGSSHVWRICAIELQREKHLVKLPPEVLEFLLVHSDDVQKRLGKCCGSGEAGCRCRYTETADKKRQASNDTWGFSLTERKWTRLATQGGPPRVLPLPHEHAPVEACFQVLGFPPPDLQGPLPLPPVRVTSLRSPSWDTSPGEGTLYSAA